MSDYVLVERSNGIATLTLNRPEVLNALSRELGRDLLAGLASCEDDDAVRVIVLQGNGGAFCAGDDIVGRGEVRPPRRPMSYLREVPYYNLMKAIRTIQKPVIARVHGYALGAGCDLVLASDIAIATENAKLGVVFVRRGIAGGTYLITKHLGLKKATELLFTGDTVEGKEAERLGLVTRAVAEQDLDATVNAWAERFANAPTRVLGYIKLGINRGLAADIDRGVEAQEASSFYASLTEDYKEGRAAFREKREARFSGR